MSENSFGFGIGGLELGIIFFAFLPFILMLYCAVDILRSGFKEGRSKFLFLALVILAPLVGSIIYLLLRNNYKMQSSEDQGKMPL